MSEDSKESLLEVPDLKWPSQDDDLFKEGEDWWNTAIVDTRGFSRYMVAGGFKQAADLLVQHVNSTQMDQDSLVFPIMFSYRQYLELTLKRLILDGRSLLGRCGEYPAGHDLRKLWRECRILLDEIFPDDSEGPHDAIEKNIEEFMKVDPKSEAYRYLVDKKGDPIKTHKTRVPLVNVAQVMDGIANLFSGSIDAIDAYRDSMPSMDEYF